MQLEASLTAHQLRCNGIIEATRVLSLGFACRTSYESLRHRYEILTRGKPLSRTAETAREWCPLFLAALGVSEDEYRFGKTKIFLRSGVIATLEKMRGDWLDKCAVAIQKVWRARNARRAFLRLRKAAETVKRYVMQTTCFSFILSSLTLSLSPALFIFIMIVIVGLRLDEE